MTINIENEYENIIIPEYEKVIINTIEAAMDYIECPYDAEVNVLLTDNETIHNINLEQRNIDNPTDVLSFPMVDYTTPGDFDGLEDNMFDYFNSETDELMLGDIVISIDRVYEQATSYNHSNTRELAFLVAHSMLHLFGYDHIEEDERVVMESKQDEILNICGYTRNYEETV